LIFGANGHSRPLGFHLSAKARGDHCILTSGTREGQPNLLWKALYLGLQKIRARIILMIPLEKI